MKERLREYAVKLQAIVKDNPLTILQAMRTMTRATGARTILKEAGITARQLVNNHPDLFEKRGRKILAKATTETNMGNARIRTRLRPMDAQGNSTR